MRTLIICLAFVLAWAAGAQEVATTPAVASEAPPWVEMLIAAIVVLIPSVLNTFVNSNSWYGRIITRLALAIGKAAPDPKVQ